MRKISILLFLFLANLAYGQNYSTSQISWIIHDGDLRTLDFLVDTISNNKDSMYDWWMFYVVSSLNKVELRLLRNIIYARHGYIFNSIDLQEHFSQFRWYVAIKTNVDSDITENEKIFVEFIRRIENNYPFNITEDIIGLWFDFPNWDWLAYSIRDRVQENELRFWPNGIFRYVDKHYLYYCYGFWSLENNVFKLNTFSTGIGYPRIVIFNYDSSQHTLDTTEFEEELIFIRNITENGEVFLECNFKRNMHSWKKISEFPWQVYLVQPDK